MAAYCSNVWTFYWGFCLLIMNFHLLSKLHVTQKWVQKSGRNIHYAQNIINSELCSLVLMLGAFTVGLSSINGNCAALCLLLLLCHFPEARLRLITSVVLVCVSMWLAVLSFKKSFKFNVKLGRKIVTPFGLLWP